MQGEHSSKQYDAELESIRSDVLMMGGIVEAQLSDAMCSFRTGNLVLADAVIQADSNVNRLEVLLDDACSHLIVKRQPAANDLRAVIGTVKLITDLERIGDEASKIARTAQRLHRDAHRGSFDYYAHIRTLGEGAARMVNRALDAFARLDQEQARTIITDDEAVNFEFRTVARTTITYMMEDPRLISGALDVLWVAKALERIADHAKGIAEYVVYIVEGKDIRHIGGTHAERIQS
ncbi:phosphate signaling complex protein PhoU [Massilia putida]|uniref:phosphate signaling complex protein PhoU n=1 Tax=Massilia putida TaxID=1141883 RepID=UPI0009520EAD|nr:phosphate signaling complex protein PhoU [Massilia putida]